MSLRWRIALLVSLAIAISYLDRQTLPIAIGEIQRDIPISNTVKAVLDSAFLLTYGLLLACSTFNRAVEYARPMIRTPLLQIDRPMMDLAVRQGSRLGLIATVPTTVPASERLLRLAATEASKTVEIETRLCSEAFAALKAGSVEKHNELLLAEIDRLSASVDAIVLAQLSMSALEPKLTSTKVPVFNSGRTAFTHIRQQLERAP